jgi:hypothetical protein
MGGMYQENPFFVPPDEFLRDFSRRRDTNQLVYAADLAAGE